MSNYYIGINKCPLCSSKERKKFNYSKPNLYSECLSKKLNINEKKLIKIFLNYKCKECSLIYKKNWFKDHILYDLFQNFVPIHQKGIDIFSNRFSKKNFILDFNLYKNHLEKNENEKVNKYKRRMFAILNAIHNPRKKKFIRKFCFYIEKNNLEKLNNYLNKILSLIKKPMRFSRFTGYGDKGLWNYVKFKSRNIKSYAEIGCPSWGMLSLARKDNISTYFIQKKENNYWGKKCHFGKGKCIEKSCVKGTNLKKLSYCIKQKEKISAFGIINYLDHLKNPKKFLSQINKISYNQILISDDAYKNNTSIQHFTGWNKDVLKWIGKMYDKKIDLTFSKYLPDNYFAAFIKN